MTPPGTWRLIALAAALVLRGAPAYAEASVEGRVALPKPLHPPVMNKRYGIVSYNGVLSPYPPLAVIYLEGAFPAPGPLPTAQMVQKGPQLPARRSFPSGPGRGSSSRTSTTPTTTSSPTHRRSASTWGATAPTRGRSPPCSSTCPGW